MPATPPVQLLSPSPSHSSSSILSPLSLTPSPDSESEFELPSTLHTPRLTLSLFSPTSAQDAAYVTALFPGFINTVDEFQAFCASRALLPWRGAAVVYLLRLRLESAEDEGGDEEQGVAEGEGMECDAGEMGEIMGHVSLAHSLQERQPRVISTTSEPASPSGVSEEAASTPAYASSVLESQTIPDIGYRLLPPYQGQGYASEAVEGFLQYLCDEEDGPQFDVLCVFTQRSNERSVKLAQGVGFVDAAAAAENESEEGAGGGVEEDEFMAGVLNLKQYEDVDTEERSETTKGVLSCERVRRGTWFGVRPAGWKWKEGGEDRELRRSIEMMFS